MKRLTIIGSTGSIGQNTLSVVEHFPERFSVFALAANSGVERLAEQTAAFHPRVVAIADASRVDEFQKACAQRGIRTPEVISGVEGLRSVSSASEVDLVVSAAVGAAGLEPTYAAAAAGKTIALANKEAMVVAGELLRQTASASGARIIPVDSEHSALDQCLRSGAHGEVRRLILTASGGPFRETPAEELAEVTPEKALKHPTWTMGRRITVDSATLMNKGFEVIEARWLFDIPEEKVDILVHPQSVAHSMVEFVDGSIVAQLGTADMRQPIQYALTYPERIPSWLPPLDWTAAARLEFFKPDTVKFPCIPLAYRAIRMGGTAPAALNAADEVAVDEFLHRGMPFTDIPKLINAVLDAHRVRAVTSIEAVLEADRDARKAARQWRAR
ncbi:MAG TPA: 1-deoxy-D-xylulose-5-phosphate reductoisomerase [Terriglobia bacterium]|nr:1-deoxy-D-xylulose-5-phosphate reductoisomerase [Terriglobia bacterium]